METIETGSDTKSLLAFCEEVISRHKAGWPPRESALAQEFTEEYSLQPLFGSEQIVKFSDRLGIGTTLTELPKEMHGFNCSTGAGAIILLSDKEEFPGSREHTFFHELREIMEYHFFDLGFPTLRATELERHAEEFAMHARMAQSLEMMKILMASVDDVEVRWKRVLGYVAVFAGVIAWSLTCALLPQFEDRFSSRK